jgi:hypothetical protein
MKDRRRDGPASEENTARDWRTALTVEFEPYRAGCLLALQAVVGMAVVVPNDEDAHAIAYDPVEEVIGETFEVDPPQVGFICQSRSRKVIA